MPAGRKPPTGPLVAGIPKNALRRFLVVNTKEMFISILRKIGDEKCYNKFNA
jgi:hypothetical protein